ncbi:MAG: M28 family metallopeptidase [Candidatus Hermodarchaeota archaeon]
MHVEISESDATYMYALVEKIINEVGPRMSCSPQELQGANMIKRELNLVCDETALEEFYCSPRAFLGWTKIIVIIGIISILLNFLTLFTLDYVILLVLSLLSFIMVFSIVLVIWEEFFNYREFIDRIYRKKKSQNVVGTFKSQGEVKNLIIFSSHIDSALQFNLLKWLRWGALPLLFGALLVIIIWFFLSFIYFVIIISGFILLKSIFIVPTFWLFIFGLPCFTAVFLFVPFGDKGNVVPGAVDNLSSCAVIVGLARYLNKHRDIIPPNTEIRCISFGCEECGLRGAFRYVEHHLNELKMYNSSVINMDGLETPDGFLVIDYEPTTRTKHSEEIVRKLIKAAEDVNISAKKFGSGKLEKTVGKLSGGSDATAFSKAQIKAGFINSADWKNRSTYYHQNTDTIDKIKKKTLENALRICIAFILNESK